MIRRPPRSTLSSSSAASDVYKRQGYLGQQRVLAYWLCQIAVHSRGKAALLVLPPRCGGDCNDRSASAGTFLGANGGCRLVAIQLRHLAVHQDGVVALSGGRLHRLGAVQHLSLIHISEPTRLLSISYAVFCLKKKK